MRIAIPLNGLRMAAQLLHSDQCALIDADVRTGNIARFALMPAAPRESSALRDWLRDQGVQAIIAADIDQQAQKLLAAEGMLVEPGTPGETAELLARAFCEHQGNVKVAPDYPACHQ